MSVEFIPTADLADKFLNELKNSNIFFHQYGKNTRAVGKARTVCCQNDNLLVKEILNTPGNGDILVIDGGGNLDSALVGDIIAGDAVRHNWSAIIVYGAVRDTATIIDLPIVIKALGPSPRKSSKTGSGEKEIPITIGNLTISPGDYIFTDEDGIVLIDQEQLALLTQ